MVNLACPTGGSMKVILKHLEAELSFDPAIILLDIYTKEYKSFYHQDTCTHMFNEALSMVAKTWNQPKCPSVIHQMKKTWHI